MGSRTRAAAAACLIASGLLAGGVSTATAFADPGPNTTADTSDDGGAESPVRQSDSGRSVDDGDEGAPPDRERGDVAPDRDSDPDAAGAGDPADGGLEVPAPERQDPGDPRPPCCERGEKDCVPGPKPDPEPDPDGPPRSDSDGGGLPDPPVGLPFPGPAVGVPPELVPPVGEPPEPDVLDAVPGAGVASGSAAVAPISVPVLVAAPTGSGGAGGPAGGSGAGLPAAPRPGSVDPVPARQQLPATAGGTVAVPASSFRVGYGEYLRTAGISQIAAVAIPGLAGIVVLTAAGGLLGYRQAKAGRAVRATGSARFMN